MNSFPEDLLAIILSKLPIKFFTIFKLVCKQWKSIVESPYFRDMFLSMHQNSHSSSWTLMFWHDASEIIVHYGCNNTWGLEQSMGSYFSSFLNNKFETKRDEYSIWAHTDVGLILISEVTDYKKNRSLYVANPVSQECVQIPSHAHLDEYASPLGLATRTEKGVLLDYKVVLYSITLTNLLIYSSETGLWSLHTNDLFVRSWYVKSPISLNGSVHLVAINRDHKEVVVSLNVYATGTNFVQCRETPFPDIGKEYRLFRSCLPYQGSLMYMNIISTTKVDGSLEEKLCVWRLHNEEWQLLSKISSDFIDIGLEYLPLGLNPFDAKTVFFWSTSQQILISIDLCNRNFELHTGLECTENDGTLSPFHGLGSCVFPQWLHPIPVRRV